MRKVQNYFSHVDFLVFTSFKRQLGRKMALAYYWKVGIS